MHSVLPIAPITITASQREDLRAILVVIGHKESEERKRKSAGERLSRYPRELVEVFLLEQGLIESTRYKRRNRWICPLFALTGLLGGLLPIVDLTYQWLMVFIICLLLLTTFLASFDLINSAGECRIWKGISKVLPHYARVEHTPLLVDTLQREADKKEGKDRLIELLPQYQGIDAPSLSSAQQSLLLREVRVSFHTADTQGIAAVTETDLLFLVVALNYFEKEISMGRTVPRQILSLLTRTNKPLATMSKTIARWKPVQEAAEDCLVRIQNTGH